MAVEEAWGRQALHLEEVTRQKRGIQQLQRFLDRRWDLFLEERFRRSVVRANALRFLQEVQSRRANAYSLALRMYRQKIAVQLVKRLSFKMIARPSLATVTSSAGKGSGISDDGVEVEVEVVDDDVQYAEELQLPTQFTQNVPKQHSSAAILRTKKPKKPKSTSTLTAARDVESVMEDILAEEATVPGFVDVRAKRSALPQLNAQLLQQRAHRRIMAERAKGGQVALTRLGKPSGHLRILQNTALLADVGAQINHVLHPAPLGTILQQTVERVPSSLSDSTSVVRLVSRGSVEKYAFEVYTPSTCLTSWLEVDLSDFEPKPRSTAEAWVECMCYCVCNKKSVPVSESPLAETWALYPDAYASRPKDMQSNRGLNIQEQEDMYKKYVEKLQEFARLWKKQKESDDGLAGEKQKVLELLAKEDKAGGGLLGTKEAIPQLIRCIHEGTAGVMGGCDIVKAQEKLESLLAIAQDRCHACLNHVPVSSMDGRGVMMRQDFLSAFLGAGEGDTGHLLRQLCVAVKAACSDTAAGAMWHGHEIVAFAQGVVAFVCTHDLFRIEEDEKDDGKNNAVPGQLQLRWPISPLAALILQLCVQEVERANAFPRIENGTTAPAVLKTQPAPSSLGGNVVVVGKPFAFFQHLVQSASWGNEDVTHASSACNTHPKLKGRTVSISHLSFHSPACAGKTPSTPRSPTLRTPRMESLTTGEMPETPLRDASEVCPYATRWAKKRPQPEDWQRVLRYIGADEWIGMRLPGPFGLRLSRDQNAGDLRLALTMQWPLPRMESEKVRHDPQS
jgi:hypothetical protein